MDFQEIGKAMLWLMVLGLVVVVASQFAGKAAQNVAKNV